MQPEDWADTESAIVQLLNNKYVILNINFYCYLFHFLLYVDFNKTKFNNIQSML